MLTTNTSLDYMAALTLYGGGLYHIETSPLICCANQWTNFYMIKTSVMKELKQPYDYKFFPSPYKHRDFSLALIA